LGNRIHWGLSFLTLAVLWLAAEMLVRLNAESLWSRLPHSEPLSQPLLSDRIRAFKDLRKGKKLCLALGDSVFFGSALREKKVTHWEQQTPTAFLRQILGDSWVVLDLSADGLELADMLALLESAKPLNPDAVVMELNIRMLADEAGQWPGCMSRPWLWAQLAPGSGIPQAPANTDFEKKTFSRMESCLTQASAVARYAQLGRAMLFQPSANDTFAAWVKTMMPGDQELDPDDLLDLKIRPYYASPGAASNHVGLQAMDALASEIKAMEAANLVFLTPQNLNRVGDFLNRDGFAANRKTISMHFAGKGLRYRDMATAMPSARFLDHCHLDPQGNHELAITIAKALRQ
jgi:hypothetical protein